MAGKTRRGGNRPAQRFVIRFVRGGASRAAIDDSPHGNSQSLLGNILMNGVVGEPRERVIGRVNVNFGFVGFAQLENAFREMLEVSG